MSQSVSAVFTAMSPEDKAALKALQAEEEARTGKKIAIGDVIRAVTPDMPDPDYLSVG